MGRTALEVVVQSSTVLYYAIRTVKLLRGVIQSQWENCARIHKSPSSWPKSMKRVRQKCFTEYIDCAVVWIYGLAMSCPLSSSAGIAPFES